MGETSGTKAQSKDLKLIHYIDGFVFEESDKPFSVRFRERLAVGHWCRY